ncbi:MAG: helix-turn-helix domain-containing protein [Ilumatobacteraceae bacterium]
MSTLQQQARALGDPTRHAIFRYVVEAGDAVDVAELTSHFGFNHNAIRQHLAKLVDAGLVVESSAPAAGRGRPKLLYRSDPSADSRWGVVGPFERLATLLLEIVRSGDTPVDVGRRAVERQRLGATMTDVDPFEAIVEQMARRGFEPEIRRRGDQADVILHLCPFASAAQIDPDTVCGLHLGMAYGVAEVVQGLVIDELVTQDPRHAGCRLRCHVEHVTAT